MAATAAPQTVVVIAVVTAVVTAAMVAVAVVAVAAAIAAVAVAAANNMQRALVVLLVSLVVAVGALAAIWYVLKIKLGAQNTTSAIATTTTFESLMVQNAAFGEASAADKSGDYATAITKYREALAQSNSTEQSGQIQVKLALALQNNGNLDDSIALFQSVAKNTKYSRIMRASAVQDLGLLYDVHGSPDVYQKIFNTDPFSSMVATTTRASLKNLYSYAVQLYPLANAEMHIADYYATLLVNEKRGIIQLTPSDETLFKSIVGARIADGTKDMLRMKTNANETLGVPDVLKRKAIVIGKLAEVGIDPTSMAEAAYVDAMNAFAAFGPGQDGYVRYFYAAYRLALKYPADQVRSVLSPIYTNGAYHGTNAEAFFASERGNLLGQKQTLSALAAADPKFKDYLISLGWSASDFAQKNGSN